VGHPDDLEASQAGGDLLLGGAISPVEALNSLEGLAEAAEGSDIRRQDVRVSEVKRL